MKAKNFVSLFVLLLTSLLVSCSATNPLSGKTDSDSQTEGASLNFELLT